MSEPEYRQDDQTRGYCPHCGGPVTMLGTRGYCERHGYVWADWYAWHEADNARTTGGTETPKEGT